MMKLTVGALLFCSIVAAGQPEIISVDKIDQIREEALRPTLRKGVRTFSLTLTYVPSGHPEIRIALSNSGGSNEVELIEAENSTSSVINQLHGTDNVDIKSAAAMLKTRRTRVKVDVATADEWIRSFRSDFSKSLKLLRPINIAQMDGTDYQAEFTGEICATLRASGSEIGSVQRSDPDFVRWMNRVLEQVRKLARR